MILESARLAHWNRGSNVVAQRAFASVRRYIIGADQRNPGGQDTVETMSESEMTALHDWLRGVRYADDDTEREKPLAARHNALIRGRPTALAIGGRNDPEFTAMQTWFVQEAARALSVPPPLLDDLSRATYANVRDLVRHWYMSTLTANLKFYENLLTRRLCATNLDAIGLRIAFDTSDVEELQPDRMQTTQRVIQEYNARLVTYEEAREQLGYDPDVMVESPQQPEPEPPEDDAS